MSFKSSLIGFAKKTVSSTGAWSKKLVASVFPKKNEATLTTSNVKQINTELAKGTKPHICQTKRWNESQVLDLSATNKLPEDFSCPKAVKVIKVHTKQQDKPDTNKLLNQPQLRTTLPKRTAVKVQYVMSKREVLDILQNRPDQLTPKMAKALVGAGVQNSQVLSKTDIFTALQRMEDKFSGTKLPSAETREILLGALNKNDGLMTAATKLTKVLKDTKFQKLTRADSTPQEIKTQDATQRELTKVRKELTKLGMSENQARTTADSIFAEAKAVILRNAKEPLSRRNLRLALESTFSSTLPNDTSIHAKQLMNTALRSLKRLETMYENGNNKLSANYQRLTRLNATEDEKQDLIFNTGIVSKITGATEAAKVHPGVAALLGIKASPQAA